MQFLLTVCSLSLSLLCEHVWSVNLFITWTGFYSTCQLGHGAVRGSARVSWRQVTLHRIHVTEEIPKGDFAAAIMVSHLVTCLLLSAEAICSKPLRITQHYIKAYTMGKNLMTEVREPLTQTAENFLTR